MKNELRRPHRRAFWTALQTFALVAALICPSQVRAENCDETYSAIKSAAMYCGFFCDQDKLRPLQVAYESQCIVSVIPASTLGFDSSADPSAVLTNYSQPQPQVAVLPQPVIRKSQQLLKAVQTINAHRFASKPRRTASAEAFLDYCKSALGRVPYSGPRVGLTEESGDRIDAQLEFAHWRLSTIFGDCAEAAHGIIDAQDVRQEAAAWLKLIQLLEQDEAVRKLGMTAGIPQLKRNGGDKDDIFGTGNWRAMRTIIGEAATTLRGNN
jgi:hypothetical protein